MAAIVTDAPVKLETEKAEIAKIDKQALKKEFQRLGFKSLLARVSKENLSKSQDNASAKAQTPKKDDGGQMNLI